MAIRNGKDDGGPAFPAHLIETRDGAIETSRDANLPGMSLRDYFAAKALLGALSNAGTTCGSDLKKFVTANAEQAYLMADAMLAERAK